MSDTAPDFRALCAELVDSLENARRIIQGGDGTLHINTAEFVLRRARAALATPNAQHQLRGVEWEDDDGPTPGWKQLARQGR